VEIVTTFTDGGLDVVLEQYGNGLFRVTYGDHIRDNLEYSDAYKEFGSCIFHSACCAGKLDNSED
jgi:hypothetical protein